MILLVGDVHFGARNSSQFYLNKTIQQLETLLDSIKLMNNVEGIFFLGDFFDDRREVNILVYNKAVELLNKFETLNIPIYYILGNHDTYFKSDNSVNIEPVFEKYKNLTFIKDPKIIQFKEYNVAMIPWINKSNEVEYGAFINAIKNKDKTILLGHFEFPELMLNREVESGITSVNYFNKFYKVYSGHYHVRLSKKNITYIGSLLDFKWGEEINTHGFYEIKEDGTEKFYENNNQIHKKYVVNSLQEMINILNECSESEIKIILSSSFSADTKEYEKLIKEIDEKALSLQVYLPNSIMLNEQKEEIKIKNFEEFISSYISGKQFTADINKLKVEKLLLTLYQNCS